LDAKVAARVEAKVEVEEIAHLSDDDWDAAVSASQLPFRFSHRAAAGRAFETAYPSYRYEPCRVSYRDGTVALFPLVRVARRLPSLSMFLGMPLSWEGTPVVLAGELGPVHVEGLFRALGGRGQLTINGGLGGSPPAVGDRSPTGTHILDLQPGFDALWEGAFSPPCRNRCRKAESAGVTVRRGAPSEAREVYYGLYAAATREWGYEEPPYPRALFDALLESKAAQLWLAFVDESPIAGLITLQGSDDLYMFTSAMDRDHRQVAPANALERAVIETACEQGLSYYDLGGSLGIRSLEKFKESFGARPHESLSVQLSSPRYRALERWRARLGKAVPGS
jgi:hypothetical protein